ncbi:hypothetical protein GSI_12676 [Ganoderma sinense ZZ0214-1]|uniref:Yeast cell wall synthesis Kre9/Knh1-like N-terminal domain-containing protein n=1 Tax=Ganoderma sinense ZZ0214-1 TaxID=1077348 RepID=A0A2G8RTG4_9APHY|nr:hypothetical protein GSI_12676 [Ganoderma sinense ZZ0214-1]
MFAYASLAALIASAAFVHAEVVPTAPGPGDIFKEGGQCTFTWDVDTSGVWKTMNVELMTGSNTGMVHITTVATLDGTDASKTTYSYNCPNVTPNSAIYFYQFSTPAAPSNLTWTTRFTIAAADGSTTSPENETEPNGQAIPWGTGALVDPSTAVAAPSYITGESTASGEASATGSMSASSGSTAVAGTTSAAASTPAASQTTGAGTSTKVATAPAAPSTSTSASASSANSTTSAANGAAILLGSDSYAVRAGVALGVAAFTFAFAL